MKWLEAAARVLYDKKVFLKAKRKFYKIVEKSRMMYGAPSVERWIRTKK